MSPSYVLAVGGGNSWWFVIVGVLIVLALLALLWNGRRRLNRRPDPVQAPQPRADSWECPHDHDHDDHDGHGPEAR
ncbi:hypothetical protein OKJ48_29670 [Streptomyces kunmingensis]|uniref:LPXTG cell wall anchor domain-containing protein n=1 Tax=Streptomyces kunmingensis TaxID=68225 RepID=A0ABU6CI53_9ACTN|nr:hypothetical protein [Streptomyces kunmingensis]MEB3964372.1 hypothetical protein [Streptomyces kunmingensis]